MIKQKIRFSVSRSDNQGRAYDESLKVIRGDEEVFNLHINEITSEKTEYGVFELQEGDTVIYEHHDFEENRNIVSQYDIIEKDGRLIAKKTDSYEKNYLCDFQDIIER